MLDQANARTVTELVSAARDGDQRAWEELMTRYGGLVRSVAASFRLQEADSADAVQNTWLRAVERLSSLREPERLGSWLKTIARRECLSLLVSSARERPDDTVVGMLVESSPGPETHVLQAEAAREVRAGVSALTGKRRRLVDVLFYEQPRDYATAAQLLEMPVGSIGPTRARVLQGLRGGLERAGFGPGEPTGPLSRCRTPVRGSAVCAT